MAAVRSTLNDLALQHLNTQAIALGPVITNLATIPALEVIFYLHHHFKLMEQVQQQTTTLLLVSARFLRLLITFKMKKCIGLICTYIEKARVFSYFLKATLFYPPFSFPQYTIVWNGDSVITKMKYFFSFSSHIHNLVMHVKSYQFDQHIQVWSLSVYSVSLQVLGYT